MGRARVLGAGPSGLSAALVLHRRGWQVLVQHRPARGGPLVVLNEVALHMLDSLWGYSRAWLVAQLAGACPIRERLVAWPACEAPKLVPQQALAVPVAELVTLMQADLARQGVPFLDGASGDAEAMTKGCETQPEWLLLATGRSSQATGVERINFGARQALSLQMATSIQAVPERCVLEAVPGGWLFLIPQGMGFGTLQVMSVEPFVDANERLYSLLQHSRLLASMLQGPLSPCVTYPAMPGLQLSAARQGEIAIGDAALALDPISGDGLGSGLRSAVLASAVLGAIEGGEPMANTLAHFNQRIELAARSHVGRCIELYQTAAGGEQAQAEINSMVRALARMPPQTEAFHYALGIDQARRAHTERNPV